MTPLIIIVGFLGSGKTTYLRGLLPLLQQRGLDPHVILNDYQNARVDAQLLDGLADAILPISGSCVCCGSRDEMLEVLKSFQAAPGRIVILEANGTTDAEELVELLSLEPALDRFTFPIQLSLIDGKRWQRRFWHNGLELDQVRTASFLFVSRREEIDGKRTNAIFESLRKHEIDVPESSPEEFAALLEGIASDVGEEARRSQARGCSCGHDHGCDPSHDHECDSSHGHDHHRAHHFASCQVEFPELIDRAALQEFLADLPDHVIRAKGLVRLRESPGEFHVFQKVDRFESAQILSIGTSSRLSKPLGVFIGPGIDEEELRARALRFFDEKVAAQSRG